MSERVQFKNSVYQLKKVRLFGFLWNQERWVLVPGVKPTNEPQRFPVPKISEEDNSKLMKDVKRAFEVIEKQEQTGREVEKIKVGKYEYTAGELHQLLMAYSQLLNKCNFEMKMRQEQERYYAVKRACGERGSLSREHVRNIEQIQKMYEKAELPDPKKICWD